MASLLQKLSHRISILIVASLLAGCASPDRWSAWDQPPIEPESVSVTDGDRSVKPFVAWEPEPLVREGDTILLSVESAVFAALQRNSELRIQTLNPIIAGAFEQIERGAYQPQIFGSLQASEEEVTETARATGEQFSVTGNDIGGELGLRQALPTGTDVEIAIEQDRSVSSRTPEQQGARVGLSVTQSLLRGMGPAVNLASVRQAQLDTLASVYELRGYTEAFVADVEIAYWRYVLAREEIAIFEQSLELARQQRSEVEERIHVGALSPTDGAIARGEVARRESALIDAHSDLEERRLALARLLNSYTNETSDFTIEATSAPQIDPDPMGQADDRVALALQQRPDLNEARLRLQQDRLQTVVTRNGLLPQLDLFVNLGKTGYADTFLQSFENVKDDNYDVVAGIRFNQFIGETAAKGRDLAARATREQSAEALLNHEQIVRLDVRLALNELERSRQQIAASSAIREHLEATVQGEVERLEVGSTTALQVAQARRDLLAAQIEEVVTRINYRIALINLYLAEGSLLERRGIVIPNSQPDLR